MSGGLKFDMWQDRTGTCRRTPASHCDASRDREGTAAVPGPAGRAGCRPVQTAETWVPDAQQTILQDAGRRLVDDGRWVYTWDAEGRLVSMVPVAVSGVPVGGAPKVELRFAYDWMGRRIGKTVLNTTTGSPVYKHVSYAYDHWNPVAEWERGTFVVSGNLRPLTEPGVLKLTHLCGLDISSIGKVGIGSREHFQDAGGVTGLLASTRHDVSPKDHFVPGYDANGNIIAWSDGGGYLVQRMDYDPFGNQTVVEKLSSTVDLLPSFGFSSKLRDKESGVYYYGYRYYHPELGRWISRDPLEELGGLNLHGALQNNGVNNFDLDGRMLNFLLGAVVGAGIDYAMQVTYNVATNGTSWDAFVQVDLGSIGVSALIGAVAPGAGKALQGVSKGFKAQEKAIKLADKVGRRKNVLNRPKLIERAKKAAEAEREAWKDVALIGAGIAASKIASKVANEVLDEVKQQLGDDVCPPDQKGGFKIEDEIEVDVEKLLAADPPNVHPEP